MFLLIIVLLISIPFVSSSYHIPKLGRKHTFLRIGKRILNERCVNGCSCPFNEQKMKSRCLMFSNRNLYWSQFGEDKRIKREYEPIHRDNS